MFSSRSFIVSGLTFRSFIHFEFSFVYGVRKCSSFIILQVVDQFSQHHLLKRLSFFHCISLPPLSKILSRVKQITSPGWMHETSAGTWCSGRTWRERVGREVGGGIGMGKTCEPKAFSFQCMTKFTTNKKK